MPRSQHIATCGCCLKKWVVGDCIPSACGECRAKGHTGWGCQKCTAEMYARIAASKLAIEKQAAIDAAPRLELERFEAAFSAGIL